MIDSGARKLYTLKIREEYRQMVLPCGGDEIKRLEEHIRRFGCGEPISVWSGRLLVDYDRYAIFHRLHVPFRIINNSARNSEEVIEWICRNQLQRTDLTDAMRRYLIGRQFLSLKLLGAHYSASAPSPARNRRASPAGVPKYESTPIRIRERLGKQYHIRQETIERYAAYTKAIDVVRTAAPDLAEGLLSGRLWLTVDRILELPRKTPEEIRKLNTVLSSGMELTSEDDSLNDFFPAKQKSPASSSLPSVSVKDMPSYDPDAEIASLTLTIPTWVSSMRRVNSDVDFAVVSADAKHAARKELVLLKNEVEAVLHHIKKEG